VLIYLDSVIVIYALEHSGPFQARARARLNAISASADRAAVSDLVRLECRVKPLASRDVIQLAAYDAFFRRRGVRKLRLTKKVYDRATELRAAYGLKVPDALHVATAIEGGCNVLLTNDARLSRCPDIAIEILP